MASNLSADEIHKLERRMWIEQGKGIVDPNDIFDNHAKQVIIKHLNEKYGIK
jgi:hypothetical protein